MGMILTGVQTGMQRLGIMVSMIVRHVPRFYLSTIFVGSYELVVARNCYATLDDHDDYLPDVI